MLKHTEFSIKDILKDLKIVKKYNYHTKTTTEYINIECAFDIETTSTTTPQGEKFGFMYVWMFGIKDKQHICYGRTWGQFLELLEYLKTELRLGENRRLVCYIHNLGYEFQFMRKYFEWLEVFAVDDRKPIKALINLGVEFRCSYILSGYSLEKLAKNLTTHKIEKLKGDLDYRLVRHEQTQLTQEELMYCNNDVEILLYYINEQLQQYDNNITKIPLTNTGRVRTFIKNKCLHSSKNHKKESSGKRVRYRRLMNECVLTPETYLQLKRCFMGGFTHASCKHSGKLKTNVHSIDFTSSYPSVMLTEKFPMSRPIKCKPSEFFKVLKDKDYCCMFDIEFNNIQPKLLYESYLSESKCFEIENPVINNGRVYSADRIATTITDVDFIIMQQCYTWDSIRVKNLYKFYKQYLPKSLIEGILELYENKTTLKGVEGKETEYLVSKGMLNSVYGMCVTDIVRDEIVYDDEWSIEKYTQSDLEEKIQKTNDSKTRVLYYPWGVWVTRYARKNLWTGILAMGEDYIYTDTDSIKFINYEKHKEYIDWYNKKVTDKLKDMCDFRKIDFSRTRPKTIKGIEKPLGVWDYEGNYTKFKTLGAKRYMYTENGKIHTTIRGLSKQNGVKYLNQVCNNNEEKIYKMFNDDLYIPRERTGKLTHTYIDNEMSCRVTDYLGNSLQVKSLSCIHLEPCDFTLNIAKQYGTFLKNLQQGYIWKGTKYL